MRCLVIEDEADTARYVCNGLTEAGHTTTLVATALTGFRARPSRAGPPGSAAELSCQKIVFDLQLADLPVQKIDLRLIRGSLRRSATREDARRTVQ